MYIQYRKGTTLKCYICMQKEADSEEHILPNAIGGKLTKKILCKECNEKYGSLYDSALARSLLFFSSFVKHPRRSSIPDLDCTLIADDGTQIPAKRNALNGSLNGILRNYKKNNNKYTISYRAIGDKAIKSIHKEIKHVIQRILKNNQLTQEKYKIECQKIEDTINTKINTSNSQLVMVNINLGGKEVFYACLKIALNFYAYKNKDVNYIHEAINILKSNDDRIFSITNYFTIYDIYPKDSIYHCIHIVASKQSQKLYYIISLFNCYQIFVLFNKDYKGENFTETYCYDIWNECEIDYNKKVTLSIEEINFIFSPENTKTVYKKIESNINKFLAFFVKQSNMEEQYTEDLIKLIMEIMHELAKNNFMDKKQVIEEFKQKLHNYKQKYPLHLLKNKMLIASIEKDDDNLYQLYLEEYTRKLVIGSISFFVSTMCTKLENKDDHVYIFMDSTISKEALYEFLHNLKFNNELLDDYIPKIVTSLDLDKIIKDIELILTNISKILYK